MTCRLILASCAAAALISPLAFAQSNVTVYGVLDAALDFSNQGDGTLTRVQSGGAYGSRLGFRGAEDLGGGLKAVFTLEAGIGHDTGVLQQGGRLFGRQGFVGLEGGFGSLTLGRQYSPQFYAFADADVFGLGHAPGLMMITRTNATGGTAFILNGIANTSRLDNTVVYASPTINGVKARALWGAKEGTLGNASGLSLHYTAGPLTAGAGYTQLKDGDGAGKWSGLTVGGSYLINKTRVFAGYTRDTDNSTRTATSRGTSMRFDLTNVGVQHNLSDAFQLLAQVTRVEDKSSTEVGDRDSYVFGVGAKYALSKRTTLYTSFGTIGNDDGSAYSLGGGLYTGGPVTGDARAKTLAVGVVHFF